jgi:hypothetical protein
LAKADLLDEGWNSTKPSSLRESCFLFFTFALQASLRLSEK